MSNSPGAHDVVQFLHREARLLDEGRYAEWLSLFCDDGVYWIPSACGQTDARAVPSIIHEDPALLAIRIARLQHPRAYAALPAPRTVHLIGNIVPGEPGSNGERSVESNLIVLEHRAGQQRIFGGTSRHLLRRDGENFKIALKRVDLIDCDDVHEPMTCFL